MRQAVARRETLSKETIATDITTQTRETLRAGFSHSLSARDATCLTPATLSF